MTLRCASSLALPFALALLLAGCPESPPPPPPAGPDAAAAGPDAAPAGPDAAPPEDAGEDAGEDASVEDASVEDAAATDAARIAVATRVDAATPSLRADAAAAGPDAAAAGPDAATAGPDAATPPPAVVAGPDASTPTAVGDAGLAGPSKAEKADMDAAVAALRPLLDKCFLQAEMQFFGAQRITVRFTLDAQGGVGRIKEPELVTNTLRDGKSHVCFLKAFEAARFRAPTAGLGKSVTAPFSHVPAGPTGR